MSRQFCNNCGKSGHTNKTCKEPVTSLGVICVKVEGGEPLQMLSSMVEDKSVNMLKYNTKGNRHLGKMNAYNDRVRFLLVQRKHSLGFLEFMRGRYDPAAYKGVIRLFELMSEGEIASLRDDDFDTLWTKVWRKTAHLKLYEDEYTMSKKKFMSMKESDGTEGVLPLSFYVSNIGPKYATPEWGFPKGRRAHHEKNLDCAMREFEEETNYCNGDYCVLDNVLPVKEVFYGTNSVLYKHIYYVGYLLNEEKRLTIEKNNNEIGAIGWFTYTEAVNLIRCYHNEKKKVLNEIFKYVVCSIENNKEKPQNRAYWPIPPLLAGSGEEAKDGVGTTSSEAVASYAS